MLNTLGSIIICFIKLSDFSSENGLNGQTLLISKTFKMYSGGVIEYILQESEYSQAFENRPYHLVNTTRC